MRGVPFTMFGTTFRRLMVASLLLGAAACATAAESIAWPAPPARARVRYVERRDVSPVTESRGFFAKLFDFLFGGVDREIPSLGQPSAVTWSNNGDLYVTDLASSSVYRVPADGTPWVRLGKEMQDKFGTPVGVALFGDTVFVVDAETKRLSTFRTEGTFVKAFETKMQRPVCVCADSSHVYIADALGCSVHVFDKNGNDIRSFGVRGNGPGGLNTPTNIARYGDTLFIVDAMNFRVAVVTVDGRFIRTFGILGDEPGTFSRPRGIAVDPDGHLYIVDGLQDCVNVYGHNGEYLMSFGIEGSAGPGQFQLPAGIAIGRDGKIAVADSHNHCVQIFQYLP